MNERFMASGHEEGLSNDDVGAARGTVFPEIWPGVGFETGDFVKEKLGGGSAVERLTDGV